MTRIKVHLLPSISAAGVVYHN